MIKRAAAFAYSLSQSARAEWGPWAFVPLLTPAYLLLLLSFGGQVRPEHWVLATLVPLIGYAGRRGAAFLRDAYPWLLVITTYDAVRYIRSFWVHQSSVLGCGVRDAELRVFAVAPGVTPSDWLVAHHSVGLDLFFAVPYGVFAYLALAYATFLYFKDRPRMRHFLWSFAAANFISYAMWLVLPAAPPWYIRAHGCVIDLAARPSEAAALSRVDALLGIDYFHAFYSRAASVYGAIPSMHAAYPMLGLLTAWSHAGWRGRASHLFYVMWMAGAALYLDHHWVLDVLAGWGVAAVAAVSTRQWMTARFRVTRRTAIRILTLVLIGLAFFALRNQLPAAVHGVAHARPLALLVLVLFVVWNHVATLAWRTLLNAVGARTPGLRQLVRFRIEAQAINQLVPAAGVAGEALRAVRAAGGKDVGPAALATGLDNLAGAVSGLGFALPVGIVAFVFRSQALHGEFQTALFALGLALALLTGAVALSFHFAPRWTPKLSPTSSVRKLLTPFAERKVEVRRAFARAVLLRFTERVIAIGEMYIAFHAVGAPISLAGASLVSALLIIVSLTVFFVPGQLGASEAVATAATAFLGFPASLGLAAALVRRGRQLFVCLVGLISLLVRRQNLPDVQSPTRAREAP